jgi:hypothetical protein
MSCPTCLVGFAGFGDAPDPRAFAPVRADMPLGTSMGALGAAPDQVRVLAAFGVGAVVGYVLLRTLLPTVEAAR